MLYVHEKVAKLGDVYLGGQVTSVEIQQAGSIYVSQDDKGKVKKSQPVGYENTKINIEILLEDMKGETTLEQLKRMQQLFKGSGQKKPKLLPIVNEDCAARGISKAYFKSLTSKKVIAKSKRVVSLELLATSIAAVKVAKKKSKERSKKKGSDKKSKSKKSKSKSPAKDTRSTASGKKAAKKATKK